jgi:hypothetical protein
MLYGWMVQMREGSDGISAETRSIRRARQVIPAMEISIATAIAMEVMPLSSKQISQEMG